MGISSNTLRLLSQRKMQFKAYNARNSWLIARSKYIGASDASAVMGLSPWMNERQLWEEKLGRLKTRRIDEESVQRGKESEAHIRELYRIESGQNIMDGTGIMFLNDAYPWASCTLDAFKIDDDGGFVPVEIKSVSHSNGGWEQDKIPDHYFVQILHQLAVTNGKRGELLVRFARRDDTNGNAYERIYNVDRAEVQGQIDRLMRREEVFWNKNVRLRIPPPVRVPII